MRRFRIRIVLKILIVLIGIAFGYVWIVSRVAEIEKPPCRECSDSYAVSEIPTIPFNEIFTKPDNYRGKLIRVEAIFHHDAGQTFLRSANSYLEAIYAGFDEFCKACVGTRKALTIYSGYQTWYDSDAKVIVVGRLGRIEGESNFYQGQNGFIVYCLESVEPVHSTVKHRIQYAIGRAAKTVF